MTGLHPCYSAHCIWKKRLKSCQNVTTLNYILSCVGCFFFCLFFRSLGLFVVGFFLANLSPVSTVIVLFPYLLFWNKEKQHMAPELSTWPSFNLQLQLSCTTQRILGGYGNTMANVGTRSDECKECSQKVSEWTGRFPARQESSNVLEVFKEPESSRAAHSAPSGWCTRAPFMGNKTVATLCLGANHALHMCPLLA